MTLQLSTNAFSHMGSIPQQYTCEGADISPPLQWSGVPDNTQSLVLIVDDPDAPDPKAPKMVFVHWVVYNIPPSENGLPEQASSRNLPNGALQGSNDWQRAKYNGPCPPIGQHRYFFKLYALDSVLPVMQEPNKAEIETAMQGHIIEQAELVGTYEKLR